MLPSTFFLLQCEIAASFQSTKLDGTLPRPHMLNEEQSRVSALDQLVWQLVPSTDVTQTMFERDKMSLKASSNHEALPWQS